MRFATSKIVLVCVRLYSLLCELLFSCTVVYVVVCVVVVVVYLKRLRIVLRCAKAGCGRRTSSS